MTQYEYTYDENGEPTLKLYGGVSVMGQPEYDDIVNSDLPREEKVKQIKWRGQAYRDQLDDQLHKDYARIGLGGLVSAIGALPIAITKNPVIGSAIGGGVYELGQGIMEGDEFPELMQRAGWGGAIGGTVGGAVSKLPDAAKFVNNLSGGRIGEGVNSLANRLAENPIILRGTRNLNNALQTDIKDLKVNPFKAESEVLADTPIIETEAFKTWSGNKPLVSSEEALKYPFKTGEGVTLEGFHGTKRGDRVGSEFRKDRATSGPMAFFSSNKDIAKSYAEGKADTSLINDALDYGNWYQYRDANGKLKPLSDAWYDLTPEERLAISKNAPHITFDENAENIILDPNINYGTGNYDYAIKSNKNNHLKALIDEWLQSGNLYNNEGDFYKVLEKSGINMDNINYIDPHADYSKVYDVFLSMKKPLVTNDIPAELVEKLAKEAPKHPANGVGVDMWDKNVQDGNVWIDRLKNDLSEGKSSHAWTSIPDWVTDELKNAGYDGIIDMGGKGGGQIHKVYIPFEPTQIKSVNNEGTFSLTNPNIYKAILGGLGTYQLYKNQNSETEY